VFFYCDFSLAALLVYLIQFLHCIVADAYNIYYGEESYLAGTALNTLQGLQKQQDQLNRVFQDKLEPLPDDVLQSVAQGRVSLFAS
jgi:hypothetical protein